MKLKPKYDIVLFVVIIILFYENMITTNIKVSYFGLNFNRKSTYNLNLPARFVMQNESHDMINKMLLHMMQSLNIFVFSSSYF